MSKSLRAVILQELRTKFSSADWRIGSLARELIVEPLAAIAGIFQQHIQEAEASLDITQLLENPAENEDALDTWMERLYIEPPASRVSGGQIVLTCDAPVAMTIPENTVFSWGDNIHLETTMPREVNPTTGYNQIAPDAYEVIVDVTTIGDTAISLSQGSPLNWEGAPSHVYDIKTKTPISGGMDILTAQDKANLVRDALELRAFTGEGCINSALQRIFKGDIASCVVGQRDADKLNSVSLYIKPTNPPSTFTLNGQVEGDAGKLYCLIPGCGVLDVSSAVLSKTQIPCIVSGVTHIGVPGDGSSAVRVELLGVNKGDTVTVTAVGFPVYQECASWLNKSVHGLPFTYNIITPNVGTVTVSLNIADTEPPQEVVEEIQRYINAKPMDRALTDSEINAILSKYDVQAIGAHVYMISVYSGEKRYTTTTQVGGITQQAGSYFNDGRPVALYAFYNSVTTV